MVLFTPGGETALPITTPSSGLAETATRGQFLGAIAFNTDSGWWFGDRCRASLGSLEIVVVPRGHPKERVRLDRLQVKAIDREYVLSLQPLTVTVYPKAWQRLWLAAQKIRATGRAPLAAEFMSR
jgi:hypothetical protein